MYKSFNYHSMTVSKVLFQFILFIPFCFSTQPFDLKCIPGDQRSYDCNSCYLWLRVELPMRQKVLATTVFAAATLTPQFNLTSKGNESDERLVGVHVIFRHGARTPVFPVHCKSDVQYETSWDKNIIDNVPHTMIPFQLCKLNGEKHEKTIDDLRKTTATYPLPGGATGGELTQKGQREMFDLGQRIRHRYASRLSIEPSHVYCRSTRYPRTIGSMRCVLAGLFDWKEGYEMSEAPRIHVVEFKEEESLSPNGHNCPWIQSAYRDYEVREIVPGIIAMRNKVTEMLGAESLLFKKRSHDGTVRITPSRLFGIRDYFTCQQHNDIPIPDGMPLLLKEMDSICAYEMAMSSIGPRKSWETVGMKAVVGPFSRLLLKSVEEMSSENRCQRLRLYSTHDNMIMPILMTLNCFDDHWPKFGADITIELYERRNLGYVVRIHYCDEYIKELSLSEFRRTLETYATTQEEYRAICGTDYYSYVKSEKT